MRDQSFSAKNFRYISESEKRKGRVKDLSFFPSVKLKTDALRDRIKESKDFRRGHSGKYSASDQAIFDDIRKRREEARVERDNTLLTELGKISAQVTKRSFKLTFSSHLGPDGKPVYTIDENDPAAFYALKNLARNIKGLYKVAPENRNQIITQLKDLLGESFPYHVVRTDIENFFESIPHDGLLEKMRSDQLLSQTSLRIISQILHDFGKISGSKGVGLPRGLSISSYLSELFMRDVDAKIRENQELVFYARYVDDIIALYAVPPQGHCDSYLKEIEAAVHDKGLCLKKSKTDQSPVSSQGMPSAKSGWSFEYLGYRFNFVKNLSVVLSDKRRARYHRRLKASFTRYFLQNANNSKAAYRMLLKRVRFLTGNTQLTHNKSNAFVGIYFSNSHLTDLKYLEELDITLRRETSKLSSSKLKARLNSLSFKRGFSERTFRRFHRENEFSDIVKAWKYE